MAKCKVKGPVNATAACTSVHDDDTSIDACCTTVCDKKSGPTFQDAGRAIGDTVGGVAGMAGTAVGTGISTATSGLLGGLSGGMGGILIVIAIAVVFFLLKGRLSGHRTEKSLLVHGFRREYEANVGGLCAKRIMHDQGLVL